MLRTSANKTYIIINNKIVAITKSTWLSLHFDHSKVSGNYTYHMSQHKINLYVVYLVHLSVSYNSHNKYCNSYKKHYLVFIEDKEDIFLWCKNRNFEYPCTSVRFFFISGNS
jgi:hypothetical protein